MSEGMGSLLGERDGGGREVLRATGHANGGLPCSSYRRRGCFHFGVRWLAILHDPSFVLRLKRGQAIKIGE
jgi:hypothetical protein